MSGLKKNELRKQRRADRVRDRVKSSNLLRVSIFRSLKQIYAQMIDDKNHATVASCSSLELKKLKSDKKTIARDVGIELAKRALKLGINKVVFDRGSYLYHGRVKSLAEGLREGGLQL